MGNNYQSKAVTAVFGSEDNRRSCIALAMHHRLRRTSTYGLNGLGLRNRVNHLPTLLPRDYGTLYFFLPEDYDQLHKRMTIKQPESPARGLRSSPPACTASLVVGSSKAP